MAPLAAVRHDGRKWIQAPRPELYDLRRDPREERNLYADDASAARALEEDLAAVVADSERRALTAPTRRMDSETEDMLRALGYVAPPEQRAEMAGRDPKDGMALYNELQEARQLVQLERLDVAEARLHDVLAKAPENVTARNLLAFVALKRGNPDEAEQQYEASLARQPRQHRVHDALGMLALRRGDTDEAARRFERALELAPSDVEAMSNLGFLAAMRGNDAGAQAWYERAIAVDPIYPHVHRRLADLFYDRQDWTRALEYYRRVLAVIPTYFEALVQAGNCARFVGDVRAAAAYYDDAERVRPDSWVPPYNLACLRALNGAPDEALALLGTAVDRGLVARDLLDRNDDLDSVRTLPGWPALVERAERAAESQGVRG